MPSAAPEPVLFLQSPKKKVAVSIPSEFDPVTMFKGAEVDL